MSTYVISDIHGCYDEFLRMLDTIGFSDADELYLAGDCIEKGRQTYEMLKWIEDAPANVYFVRGNHEDEFAAYVDLMCMIDEKGKLGTDFSSHEDTAALYKTVKYLIKYKNLSVPYFDLYGTIAGLLDNHTVSLDDLCRWAEMIRKMPFYIELNVNGKTCIVVHAGYTEDEKSIVRRFGSPEQFYLYARKESCKLGGRKHAIIIAGHTPTIAEGEFAYNEGNVFRYHNRWKDCTFYDIDCGCVFRGRYPGAKLACLRMEDEKIFYI